MAQSPTDTRRSGDPRESHVIIAVVWRAKFNVGSVIVRLFVETLHLLDQELAVLHVMDVHLMVAHIRMDNQ